MPAALVIGARNLGRSVIERLSGEGWSVVGGARSQATLEKVWAAGGTAREIDVLDPESVTAALEDTAARHGRVDLVVNAASPYGGDHGGAAEPARGRSPRGPFGGGPLAEAAPGAYEAWAAGPVRGAFSFLSATSRFLLAQGGEATVVQVTGGSSRRAMPGRGLWAAGAFGVRALTQAAAIELREHGIQVTLLIVDGVIDRSDSDDAARADPARIADAVAFLAAQSPRAMTHELQVTPALDQWVP
jgi:NADP-dependent 3-hydroxy acid dehydrogenase YdfG